MIHQPAPAHSNGDVVQHREYVSRQRAQAARRKVHLAPVGRGVLFDIEYNVVDWSWRARLDHHDCATLFVVLFFCTLFLLRTLPIWLLLCCALLLLLLSLALCTSWRVDYVGFKQRRREWVLVA